MNTQRDAGLKKKVRLRRIYILGTILLLVIIGFIDPELVDLFDILSRLSYIWLIVGFLCLFAFWFTDGLLLHHITRYTYQRHSILKAFKVGIIGLYYGALTPFATGGQPMQIVYMKRDGVPIGTATCIVSLKFIIYEFSLCAIYVAAMLFRGFYFFANYQEVFYLTTIGFIVNLFAVFLIIAVMINKSIALNICNAIITFLCRIRIVKREERLRHAAEKNIEEFQASVVYIKKYKLQVALSFVLSLINLAFLFSIPYIIYIAFGHAEKNIIDLMTLQAFLYLAVSFFPLPGAAGASEGGFYIFFKSIFTNVPIFMPMLIWRFMSYYVILIFGSLFVIGDEFIQHRKDKRIEARKKKSSHSQ